VIFARFIPGLFLAASGLAVADAPPTFYAPGLVNTGQPLELSVSANQADVKSWAIQWGDGPETTFDAASVPLTHTYAKPGPYAVSVAALLADGTRVPAALDYSQLIAEDEPTALFRFSGATEKNGLLTDDSLKNPPALLADRMPWGDSAVNFKTTTQLPALPTTDRFSAEFWWKPIDLQKHQEIFASRNSSGAELYLDHGHLCFQPAKGALFTQALPDKLSTDAWHHVVVTYDRAPLFPYSNTARFYLDGVLFGDQHLDVYDTGAVNCSNASLGSSHGSSRLRGDLADLAFYASDLSPHRILQHARLFSAPGQLAVFASTPVVEPFTVDQPKITQTVSVPLNPDPAVDNAPTLRKALHDAADGTRLVLVNQTTGKPGGTFQFKTIDGGNDWSVLRIFDRHDLELDGGGATLVFGTNTQQIFVRGCQRVALRNFAMDLDQAKFRVGVYARILDLNPATGDIRFQFVNGRDFSPDRAVPNSIGMWRWRPINPKTLRIGKGPFFQTGEAMTDAPHRDANDPSILVAQLKPGMIKRLEEYRQGPNFFMVNNANFANKCISCYGGEQLTFDHLSFYADLGMVFLSGGYNHLQVTHCKIGLPPGLTAADRPLASGADGYHFHETQGDILFDHNEIALTDDDPISIKDGVWQNLRVLDGNALHMPGVNPGDEIELFNWDFSPLDYRAHAVTAVKGDITLDQPLPATLPKTFIGVDHHQATHNWILSHNDLHDYYGRLLLYTSNGLIRENRIDHSWLHLGAADVSFESDGISSFVTVYDNYLVDANADTGIWGPSSKYPVFQNIAYVFNSFLGQGLRLENAASPWVVGNYFEPRAPKAEGKEGVTLKLVNTAAPFISGNFQLATQPGEFALLLKGTDNAVQQNNAVLVSPVESHGAY
jgi:Concanavalin A-like lectin/glucanases superfamily